MAIKVLPTAPRVHKKVGAVRFQGSHWGLTYSCPVGVPNPIPNKESLKDKLLDKFDCKAWLVSKEKHESGEDHFHVYLHLNKRLDTQKADVFDMFGVHPNIQLCKKPSGWVKYCIKDGDYLHGGEVMLPCEPFERKRKRDFFREALQLSATGNLQEAIALIKENESAKWCTQGTAILAALKAEAAAFRRAQVPVVVKEAGWIPSVAEIDIMAQREGEDYPRVHVLVGEAGIGKTECAKYLLRKAGCQSILVVNRLDDLKKLEHYDGFIWDEIDLQSSKRDREFQIGMCDMAEDRSFDARYSNVEIPRGTRRVFTCNFLTRALDYRDSAIDRRIHVHDFFQEKLYQ